MGFLVGNDFIPHLPNMHINKGALPELYTAYKVFAILVSVIRIYVSCWIQIQEGNNDPQI